MKLLMAERQEIYGGHLSALQAILLLLLGLGAAFVHEVVTVIWFSAIVITIYGFVVNDIKWLWYGVAASPGLEVLARMSRAPYVPHEIGKYYLLLVLCLLFIQHASRSSNYPLHQVGIALLALLIPSIVVGFGAFNFEDWVLNVFGIVEMALLLLFISRERWQLDKFCRVVQFGLLSILLALMYLIINTPDLNQLEFALGSNFQTSGAFGSNQVSTILGLGMVFTIVLVILKKPLFKIAWLNYLLLGLLLFRGLLTFSRGGIIAAIIAAIVALVPAIFASRRSFLRFSFLIAVLSGISIIVFIKVNALTGNQLLLRYQGETPGTYAGTRERTLSTITSYRYDIAVSDWYIFKSNFFFGAGPGMSQGLRPQYGVQAIAPHIEYTRLLSEHGLGGMLVVVVLFVFPVWWVSKQKFGTWRAISGALFLLALLTSLHSAMRTNTTIVCYALASLPVYFIKSKTKETA